MSLEKYLKEFKKAAQLLDTKPFNEKNIQIQTGIWLDAVVLRIQKRHWANNPEEKPHSGAAIFMSIWLDEKSITNQRILYNMHALRLRQLNNYKLQSRAFANSFRKKLTPLKKLWPNISTDFAPQTLMEGWTTLSPQNLQNDIFQLANNFLSIENLVEKTLLEFK